MEGSEGRRKEVKWMALANLNEDLLFSFFGIFKLLSSRVNILREQISTSSTICVDIQTSIGKVQCDQGFHGGCVMECVVECVGGCVWWDVWWSVW